MCRPCHGHLDLPQKHCNSHSGLSQGKLIAYTLSGPSSKWYEGKVCRHLYSSASGLTMLTSLFQFKPSECWALLRTQNEKVCYIPRSRTPDRAQIQLFMQRRHC